MSQKVMEQLGLLVALTPQEQPLDTVRHATVWDFRQVREAADLPPRMLMGYRDDMSFATTGEGFSVGYALDGERVLDLEVEGERLCWSQRWRGLDGGGGFVAAEKPGLMVQLLPLFDEWQDELERSLHKQGNFHLQRQQPDGLHMAGMPDGVFIQVAFPVHRLWLPALVGYYEELWSDWDRGPCPTAYAYLCEMPATNLWPANLEGDEVDCLMAYAQNEYVQQLGFPQPAPDDPAPLEDGGFAVAVRRMGFMHVATLPLRDLLPYTERLVAAGIIAERRFEDNSSDLDDWEQATAARRAVVATVGTAIEGPLECSDLTLGTRFSYPTPTAAVTHLDATASNALHGLTFGRLFALANRICGDLEDLRIDRGGGGNS